MLMLILLLLKGQDMFLMYFKLQIFDWCQKWDRRFRVSLNELRNTTTSKDQKLKWNPQLEVLQTLYSEETALACGKQTAVSDSINDLT